MHGITADTGFAQAYFEAKDGLKLFARVYGEDRGHLPLVCLPGITRNSADFHYVAQAIAQDASKPRKVIAIDLRGRGLSDYDDDPKKYAVPVEVDDVATILSLLQIPKAHFLGTSRGGIVTMVMSAVKPDLVASAILNDIGPKVEAAGLVRVQQIIGKTPVFASFDKLLAVVKARNSDIFPAMSDEGFRRFTEQLVIERDGKLEFAFDPGLAENFNSFDPNKPGPELWPQFATLKGKPVMALRGSLSDLFSQATLEEMQRRHDGPFTAHIVADEGHAPTINDAATIGAVRSFLSGLA